MAVLSKSMFEKGSIYRCVSGSFVQIEGEWWQRCHESKQCAEYCGKVHGPVVGEKTKEPVPCQYYSEV